VKNKMGEDVKELSPKEKEEYVRKVLSKKFGVKLEECNVPLRGTTETYKFDLVSPDRSIVGEVKTFVYSIPSGRPPFRKIAHASEACWFLIHAEGVRRRFLVFTDKEFYENYKESRQGQMAKDDGIEIKLVEVKS
jgi:hypothetical protein